MPGASASGNGVRLWGQRFKIIVDNHAGYGGWQTGFRISLRLRTKRRPRQMNLTLTNYTPKKATGKGVS